MSLKILSHPGESRPHQNPGPSSERFSSDLDLAQQLPQISQTPEVYHSNYLSSKMFLPSFAVQVGRERGLGQSSVLSRLLSILGRPMTSSWSVVGELWMAELKSLGHSVEHWSDTALTQVCQHEAALSDTWSQAACLPPRFPRSETGSNSQ